VNTAAERTVRLSDGARTTLAQWGERGPLLVGVHGLGASRFGWARIGEHLADRYRVVAFDQRGHGDSANVGDMTFARGVADVGDVVAALGEPVHALLGHSWGGAVVVGAGRELDVVRVAAIEPMLEVERGVWARSVIPQYVELLGPPFGEREALIRAANAKLPEIEIEAKLHAGRHIALEPIVALGSENRIDEGGWAFRGLLADYPRPLWIAVAGQKRSVFSAEDRIYARERGGPNVTLTEYEGASHSLQRDAFARFIPDLEAFLA
jgi:pimeloyl-ACP methyl ester carboxylesterase